MVVRWWIVDFLCCGCNFEYRVASLIYNSFLSATVYYSGSINFTCSCSVHVPFSL